MGTAVLLAGASSNLARQAVPLASLHPGRHIQSGIQTDNIGYFVGVFMPAVQNGTRRETVGCARRSHRRLDSAMGITRRGQGS